MPLIRARVAAVHRSTLELRYDATLHTATLSPLLRALDDPLSRPCVGDWVLAQSADQQPWLVESIVPRTSLLVRRAAGADDRPQPLAANIDIALLFAPLPHGVNVRRLARLAALAFDGGATPMVLLSRADLADRDTVETARRDIARHCTGVPIAAVSAHAEGGLAELRPWLQPGRTFALLGPSGAGKSTLVNALASEKLMQTGDTRADGKGRHTTSHRELFVMNNGVTLIDTPGLREVGLLHEPTGGDDGVDRLFADITALATGCRFNDCRHRSEPACAIRAAISDGRLEPDGFEQWKELRREVDFATKTAAERRRSERSGARLMREINTWHHKR